LVYDISEHFLRTHISLANERKKRIAEERKKGKKGKEKGPRRKEERKKKEIDIRFEVLNVLALKIQVFCIVGLSSVSGLFSPDVSNKRIGYILDP